MSDAPTYRAAMDEPVLDPAYWAGRLRECAPDQPWKAIYNCTADEWNRCAAEHAQLLERLIDTGDSVLDVGCGYGRLLDLMPVWWVGEYLGVDVSPDLLARARLEHGKTDGQRFVLHDVLVAPPPLAADGGKWDWAVLISFESMLRTHVGRAAWEAAERHVRAAADKLLILEFTRGWKVLADRGPEYVKP